MQYVEIDGTNLRVSRLAYGTASLHHIYRQSQRLQLLDAAFCAGITYFDTSPYYGYGLAESDLGLFMCGRRDAITVATKVGLYPSGTAPATGILRVWLRKAAGKLHKKISAPRVDWNVQAAEHSLSTSLRRLRTDYVDILFLHEPDPNLIRSDEFLAWVERERCKGRIRYWGIAGEAIRFQEWLFSNHPLSTIVQSRDSLHGREADLILRQGRRLQFTYGYLSSVAVKKDGKPAEIILAEALQRNRDGSVLFSTRRLDRIVRLSGIVP